jgi:hypothetical protein
MADVAPIFVAPTPNLFHHNNVGLTYVGTSNFKVEPIKSIPLFYGNAPFDGYSHSSSIFNITSPCWYEVQTVDSKGNKPCEYAYRNT